MTDRVRITILSDRCQGHARCASLAPKIFDLDDDGYACLRPGGETFAADDAAAREQATIALDNCPEQAILLEDE